MVWQTGDPMVISLNPWSLQSGSVVGNLGHAAHPIGWLLFLYQHNIQHTEMYIRTCKELIKSRFQVIKPTRPSELIYDLWTQFMDYSIQEGWWPITISNANNWQKNALHIHMWSNVKWNSQFVSIPHQHASSAGGSARYLYSAIWDRCREKGPNE